LSIVKSLIVGYQPNTTIALPIISKNFTNTPTKCYSKLTLPTKSNGLQNYNPAHSLPNFLHTFFKNPTHNPTPTLTNIAGAKVGIVLQ
ncbi:MAG: hypothetical protein NZM38_07580, partial [Cytophagales bacterium]|nr:hypothetical protein [Cytophagales bacterium]MDW8384618.1 hypothetical protein [Flammeovirgaceae bacterium]